MRSSLVPQRDQASQSSTLSRFSSLSGGEAAVTVLLPVRASRNHPVMKVSVVMVGSARQAPVQGEAHACEEQNQSCLRPCRLGEGSSPLWHTPERESLR